MMETKDKELIAAILTLAEQVGEKGDAGILAVYRRILAELASGSMRGTTGE